jgi:hypothetical protein
MRKILIVLFLFICCLTINGQVLLNFQAGKSISFSQRTGGVNDGGIIKIAPFYDNTFGIGLGYRLNKKTMLMYNLTLNSHGWEVKMREAGTTSYKSSKNQFSYEYNKTRWLYENKLGILYTAWQKGNYKVNVSGGVGIYCTRCSSRGWTGERRIYTTSTIDTTNADSYILVNKRDTKMYTFLNTLVYAGGEFSYQLKKSELGLFCEVETAFGKNFEHTVIFKRGQETGNISIKNSGLSLRLGLFFRPKITLPVITIKRRVETPAQTPAPQEEQ